MLTLDRTTLFYFSFNSTASASNPKARSGVINQWVASIAPPPPMSRASSKASSTTRTSSAQAKTERTTIKSSLSDTVAIVSKNTATAGNDEDDPYGLLGGLSDMDETHGAERDAAVSSPVKGSVRKDSKVRTLTNSGFAV